MEPIITTNQWFGSDRGFCFVFSFGPHSADDLHSTVGMSLLQFWFPPIIFTIFDVLSLVSEDKLSHSLFLLLYGLLNSAATQTKFKNTVSVPKQWESITGVSALSAITMNANNTKTSNPPTERQMCKPAREKSPHLAHSLVFFHIISLITSSHTWFNLFWKFSPYSHLSCECVFVWQIKRKFKEMLSKKRNLSSQRMKKEQD